MGVRPCSTKPDPGQKPHGHATARGCETSPSPAPSVEVRADPDTNSPHAEYVQESSGGTTTCSSATSGRGRLPRGARTTSRGSRMLGFLNGRHCRALKRRRGTVRPAAVAFYGRDHVRPEREKELGGTEDSGGARQRRTPRTGQVRETYEEGRTKSGTRTREKQRNEIESRREGARATTSPMRDVVTTKSRRVRARQPKREATRDATDADELAPG